jgi:serine O-acetyltransferase
MMKSEEARASKPGLGELIRSDLAAWRTVWGAAADGRRRPGLLSDVCLIYSFVGLRSEVLFRISSFLHGRGVRVLPQVLYRLNLMLHGLDIPPSVPIGPGIYIPHPVGTVVMAEHVGAGVTFVSGVTIGMQNERAFPFIGDNVFVGAGARVLGGIVIGSNVRIGANAVVVKDVPNDCVAVGVPAVVRPSRSGQDVADGPRLVPDDCRLVSATVGSPGGGSAVVKGRS